MGLEGQPCIRVIYLIDWTKGEDMSYLRLLQYKPEKRPRSSNTTATCHYYLEKAVVNCLWQYTNLNIMLTISEIKDQLKMRWKCVACFWFIFSVFIFLWHRFPVCSSISNYTQDFQYILYLCEKHIIKTPDR